MPGEFDFDNGDAERLAKRRRVSRQGGGLLAVIVAVGTPLLLVLASGVTGCYRQVGEDQRRVNEWNLRQTEKRLERVSDPF